VDFLLLESMNTTREATAAVEAARETGLPVWVSFVVDDRGQLLSGEPIPKLETDATLVNCAPPEDISAALGQLEGTYGAYAHIGRFDPPSWKFEFVPQFVATEEWPANRYGDAAAGWIEQGARIVGGCCGTKPEHVRALKAVSARVQV
jgi:S-methylmethionine-dependent homocysteine/selenocysteine methylase